MLDSESFIRSGRDILTHIVALCKNAAIYPLNHPTVIEPASEICELLMALFARNHRVRFNIVNSEIYFEKQLLQEESIKYSDFIQLLMQWGMNSISFEPVINPESLATFFSIINKKEETDTTEESLKARMKNEGVIGINFEKLVALDLVKDVYELVEQKESSPSTQASYNHALEYMESVEQDVLANRPINMTGLRSVVSSLMEVFLSDRDAVMGIVSIKSYDEYLFHHSVNVAITSLLIASKLSLDENTMKTVGIGGLLHDIGKLKIPREIISKPERLTEDEWIIIRRHPIQGAQILMRYETLDEVPVLAALEHHAGHDLGGYPTLKGKEHPHALARIVSIADVYEAMTANRSYRPAHTVQKAVDVLIDGIGKMFDPLLVKLFLNTVGVFPPGSLVRLKSGEAAVVVESNEDQPFLPKVRTIRKTDGEPTEGDLIDTAENPAEYAITGVADPEKI